jgi:hypothetical protein
MIDLKYGESPEGVKGEGTVVDLKNKMSGTTLQMALNTKWVAVRPERASQTGMHRVGA